MGFVITHIFHFSYVEMNQLFFVIIVNNHKQWITVSKYQIYHSNWVSGKFLSLLSVREYILNEFEYTK